MKADIEHLDTFYIGDGWSRDGPEGIVQLDYYCSSLSIQVAQLIYSRLAQKEDPDRCEEFRNRARLFALDFIHYFDSEGALKQLHIVSKVEPFSQVVPFFSDEVWYTASPCLPSGLP